MRHNFTRHRLRMLLGGTGGRAAPGRGTLCAKLRRSPPSDHQSLRFLARIPLEGGNYSLSDSSPLSKDLTAVGKNLKLRGVLFQLSCLLAAKQHNVSANAISSFRDSDDETSTSRQWQRSAEPLKPHESVQEVQNLLQRAQHGRGRRDDDVRPEDLLGAAQNLVDAKASEEPSTAAKPEQSAPLGGDLRGKYAAKLRAKKVSVAGLQAANEASGAGDAAGLSLARKLVENSRANTRASKWMMAAGAGPLLGYLQNRSMSLGVFLPSTADAEMIDEREMVDSIVGQAKLYGVNFDSVTGLDTEDFAAGKEGDEELAAAQKALQQKKDDAERARPRAPPQGLWSAFVGGLMSVGLPPPKPHSVTNKLVETDEIRRCSC
mmetsp:Transcript_5997/g.23290  ORF Transcript_5997/g.23290 Transcript_5997/m.23290 type:complete len:376 (-) Transcript_5997:357-1484(-)